MFKFGILREPVLSRLEIRQGQLEKVGVMPKIRALMNVNWKEYRSAGAD